MELEDKVALVTGAGSGIGRECALALAREGAAVLVSDLDDGAGEAVVGEIASAGGRARFAHADVADPEQNTAIVKAAVDLFGGLHIACNNAGISGGLAAEMADYPIDKWQQVLNVNLSGVFYGMRAQLPAILASGGGSIVNVASILGAVGFAQAPAYVASKHGVVGLTRTAALEYSARRVRINAVGPGFIRTPLTANYTGDPDMNAQLESMHPIGRLGEAREVAELVLWLASPKASFVTGAYYPVDGGFLAR